MIAMCGSDRPVKAVWNHTSLSTPAWTVDSIVVQQAGCLKGQPAQRLSDSFQFGVL